MRVSTSRKCCTTRIHNDFLDVGQGRVLGVLLQATLFGCVLAMFWPTRARMGGYAEDSPLARCWRCV